MDNTQPPITLEEIKYFRDELNDLFPEDPTKKVNVYSPEVKQFYEIINSKRIGIPKGTNPKEIGIILEKWYEWYSNTTPAPEYVSNTTLTPEQLKDLGEQADEQKQKHAQTVKNQKEAVTKFKEAGEKRYQDQQKADALKEKQTQELLNQFFKAKVVVVPTEEIPEVKLSKENKETLIAAETAAKEDPATTKKVFEEKIQEALNKTKQEYKDIVTKETVEKSATHLVEQLRSLPDHKSVDELSNAPKSLNTLSILNPLSDPNSEEMKKMIPDKEARENFTKEVQTLMLATEAERTVNIAGAKVILGENIAYSLYGNDTLTDFQISSDEKDREDGVEISPRDVYEKGKQVSDFINKVKGFKNTEEVTSTGLAYYPTYSYSNAAVATKTTLALTKALPVAGAVYGFRQGLILSQWARSGTPLLSAGNQNLVRLLTSQTGVQEIASASMVTFSNPMGFQLGKFSIGIATGANQATGTQIAMGGIRFGEKMAGAIAVKGGTQVAIVTGTQAGAQLAVGTSTFLTKALTLIGGLGSWTTAGLSLAGGYLLGKAIEQLPKIKQWLQDNKEVFVGLGAGAGLLIGGPAVGGLVLLGGLAATGTLESFAFGAFNLFGFIGRSVGIAIATPVIITLLVLPPLVAFIMLVINNSAYVVPPDAKSLGLNVDNPYILVTKVASPDKFANPTSGKVIVTYTVTIKALKSALSNLSITETKCTVSKKNASTILQCPPELENVPALPADLTISPTSSYSFTFTSEFDSKYADSAIFDTIKIKGDSVEETGIETSGSESVCIGDCPHGCFEISNNNETWPSGFGSTLENATQELTSRFPNFVDKACSEGKTVNLCYTTKDPSPIGAGLCNQTIYAIHKHTDNCDINFNQCSLDGGPKDAFFLLTHELTHHVEDIDGSIINRYRNFGAPNELPLCSYSGTNGDNSEGAAEANALYANGGTAGFSTCSMNFVSQYPKNFMFAKDYMNNP